MNAAPSLHDLQLWLKWIITDPRGVAEALKVPAPKIEKFVDRYTEPVKSCVEWIEKTSATSTIRLDVYAEGYFSRILECMEKDFSRTRTAVSEELFTKLVAEYLKAYPSKFTSIDEVVSRFPGFISVAETPLPEWVSDLALFEWSWMEAFYAKDIAVDSQDWRKEITNETRFVVHPSARFINSGWPLPRLIRSLDTGEAIAPEEITPAEECVFIYRAGDEVLWEELDLPASQILQSLINRMSLEEAISLNANIDPGFISQHFSRWVERGILCGILKEGIKI